jgi:DNA-binding NarL/FixJ family response regulator
MKHQVIVVYGHSLFSTGVKTLLEGKPDFLVEQIDNQDPQAREQISFLQPDVLIVDTETAPPPWNVVIPCLGEQPAMLVIGLQLTSNQIMLVSGQKVTVTCMHDLEIMVEQHSKHSRQRADIQHHMVF